MQTFLEILQTVIDFIYFLIPYSSGEGKEKLEQIVAHRGWHSETLKENTLNSFSQALERGLWGIEFDVRWTQDHVPIICHDPNTSRVFGESVNIAETSLEDLKKWIPEIPTLEEVVKQFGKKIHLFIELKEVNFEHRDIYKEKLIKILDNLTPGEDYHFLSLSMEPILNLDIVERQYYLLVGELNFLYLSELAIKYQLGGITGHYALLTSELIKKHKMEGQKVGTGFIRTKNLLYREKMRDVDFVFTNHPQNLLNSLS